MSQSDASPQQQSILLRLLKATRTGAANLTFYAAALGAVALAGQANLPPEFEFFFMGVGVNAISDILKRLAQGEDVSDAESQRAILAAIEETRIEQRLASAETQSMIARLFHRFDVLQFTLQQNEITLLQRLTEQAGRYETLAAQLREGIAHIYADVRVVREQNDEILALQRQLRDLLAPAFTSLHQLPAPPGDFTGRQAELDDLLAHFDRGAAISGLHGMGGVGKTALALKLAEQFTPRYPDAQLFVELKGTDPQPLSAAEVMTHVIHSFQPTAQLPNSEAELRPIYNSVLHGRRVLLLLDNAAGREQIEPLLLPPTCALLVTSRTHFHVAGLYPRNLDVLPPADARGLLLTIAPRIGDQSAAMAELCGQLPLALRLAAGALAERDDLSVDAYLRCLRDSRARLELVEASLDLSYDLLSPELQRQWRMLAVFPATFDVPAAAAVWQVESDAAQDTLSELRRLSLVEWDAASKRYRLHDLVRLFADAQLSDGERLTIQLRFAAYYLEILSTTDDLYLRDTAGVLEGLALFDLERINIEAGEHIARVFAAAHDRAAQLSSDYAISGLYCRDLRQHPREKISWLEAAITAARRLKDRPAEGMHLGNLGNAYHELGNARRAIEYYEQALVIDREVGDRRGEGQSLGNLGLAYADLGDARRAIEYHEQALAIDREIGAASRSEAERTAARRGEGINLGNLGLAYADLGDARRAIEYHEQALAIARQVGDRRGEGNSLGNLGIASKALGDTRRAIEFYKQTLGISREVGDRRGEGIALKNLGVAYYDLGDVRRAIEFFEQVLIIARESDDRNGEGIALGNLGNAYAALGDAHRAIEFYEQQLPIAREVGDRRGEGNALGNLGNAYAALGDAHRAIELYEQSLAIAREIGDRRGEGAALFNMSLALDSLGQRDKAIPLAEAALNIFERIEDPNAEKVRRKLAEWRGQ